MSEESGLMLGNDGNELEKICPYLGLQGDPSTSYAFPNPRNFCHRSKSNQSISLAHQTKYCLSQEYPSCPIFQSPKAENNLIQSIDSEVEEKKTITIPTKFWVISLLVFSILVITMIIYNYYHKKNLSLSESNLPANPILSSSEGVAASKGSLTITESTSAQALSKPQITPSLTLSFTSTPLPTLTPITSPTPTITLTPTPSSPTPGPMLDEPFGPDNQFILHKVKQGEALSIIAQTYQTTVEVLRMINNVVPGASIWADSVIVVIPGQQDIKNIPKFKVIQIEEPTDIDQISTEYQVSIDELKYFNQLGDASALPAGRWLLIPIGK